MNGFETILIVGIPLGIVLWGVAVYHQKGTWFVAGWNTMPKEEKAAYNEKAMCRLLP